MLTAYRHYLLARRCFDSQIGFASIYQTRQQVEEAEMNGAGAVEPTPVPRRASAPRTLS